MVFSYKPFLLTALLALPLHAFAQDTASEPETETEAATEEQPAADGNDPAPGELSLGTSESTEPQVGQTYIRSEHGDWELRCVRTEDGQDPCQLYQLLQDGAGNSVAEINLFNLPEGQQAAAGATIVTPLETLLTPQLRLAVDSGDAKRYPFSFCSQIGCFSRLGFTADEVNGLKRGAQAMITIVPAAAPNDTVELTVSLTGFTAGWDAVVAANAGE